MAMQRLATVLPLLWALVAWAPCALAAAQKPAYHTDDNPIDAYARWAVSQGVWKGPTTPFPDPVPRPPDDGWRLPSTLEAVAIHAPPAIPEADVQAALRAAEQAMVQLRELGWALAPPDGGRGGTPGFDIYLQRDASPSAGARVDGSSGHGLYDDAITYAVVNPDASHLSSCVASAVVQGGLLGLDPAESERWRQATGAYVAWLLTGRFGCEDADVQAQRHSAEGWLPEEAATASRGGLLLALLADRADGGSGAHIRELWQFARQRSQEVGVLRASPNMWEVIARSQENASDDFEELAVDLGVARYFAGPPGRRAHAPYPTLRMLPPAAAVPIERSLSGTALPAHVTLPHPLGTLGSAYVRIHIRKPAEGQQLKVWLRGERGPRWALSAIRLGAEGQELGRLHAPARTMARGFLPLLLTPDTRSVLLVVTSLPTKLETTTRVPQLDHGAKLIIDLE